MSQASSDSIGLFHPNPTDYFKGFVSGFSLTASLVVDQNGSTVTAAGDSKGIGDSVDLALLIALRRQSELVLTSGLTFRQEVYKMPKNADLAVFSRNPVDFSGLDLPEGANSFWIGPEKAIGYLQALDVCRSLGYEAVHIEFGEQGISELYSQKRIDALFISSVHPAGLERFIARMGYSPLMRTEISGLSIGLVAWQQ